MAPLDRGSQPAAVAVLQAAQVHRRAARFAKTELVGIGPVGDREHLTERPWVVDERRRRGLAERFAKEGVRVGGEESAAALVDARVTRPCGSSTTSACGTLSIKLTISLCACPRRLRSSLSDCSLPWTVSAIRWTARSVAPTSSLPA